MQCGVCPMIVDVTGTELIPGNFGRDCPGNGEHRNIECCCEECNYYLRCFPDFTWLKIKFLFKKRAIKNAIKKLKRE